MARLVAAVDDDPDFLLLVRELLGWEGYRVLTIERQAGALERLRAARPDLIILDLVLEEPGSGWQLLEELRRDADLAASPLVLCTADARVGEERAADLERLRAEVLTKPFHIRELRGLVLRLIGPPDGAER